MDFRFDMAVPVLRRTPPVLRDLVADLPASWTDAVEGPNTDAVGPWKAYLSILERS